ncbi:glycosyl hydrolase [Pontibacter beigongshangensis]|uniref:glycosyl hydrolase n=1 Tax=Pontibacter beigongshangensis TaxID=2574733 RepID=UPI00165061F0|nr:glycosyl hydrolase [Pontibacter beigongshangensis]
MLWLGLAMAAAMTIGVVAYRVLFSQPSVGTAIANGFDEPIVIIKGGTYTGNWVSSNSNVPAVEIKTSEPVIIANSTIRGAGYLIKSWGHSADLTVRNTTGYGIRPTMYVGSKKPRRFITLNNFKNLVVEHNYLVGTAGIYLGESYDGDGSTSQTVKIRYNKVRNIDGRVFGGEYERSQFVQFNFVNPIPHAEIAWNEVINEQGNSLVEDNINIYNTRGTPDSPIRIHNNYIEGAFPFPVTEKKYTGGGIITDSPGTDSLRATAHLKIYDNQLVGLGNYCIGIAGGNHIEVYNNTGIVAAAFDDGTAYPFWTSGIWARDYYDTKATYNNRMYQNTLSVVGKSGSWRNEIMAGIEKAANTFDNIILEEKATKEMERLEYLKWQQKLDSVEIVPGPQPATSTAGAITHPH